MDLIFDYAIPFLIVLSVLVFVHEWGHFWVARRCGVRVEVFSIGFGPELFGRTDRRGTRWKISAVPLGGYVKFFGDVDAASRPDDEETMSGLTEADKAVSFHHKPLGARALIVAAGPLANFLFAAVVLAGLFAFDGHPFPPAVVGDVVADSVAEEAGLEAGDRVARIDGQAIHRFADLAMAVRASEGRELTLEIDRDGQSLTVPMAPQLIVETAQDGTPREIYRLGITVETGPYGFGEAIVLGGKETAALIVQTVTVVGQIIVGTRGTDELGGPLRIAQISGDVAQIGIVAFVWFMAVLSINLGLINLFPIPMLDGGHLLYYAAEAIRGRPLGPKAQEYGFRIGLALVLTLMIFATWNDLVHVVGVVDFIRQITS